MLNYSKMLTLDPFSLPQNKKKGWFLKNQKILSQFHFSNCSQYQSIVSRLNFNLNSIKNLSDIPIIPAKLFKILNMKSTFDQNISAVLTSSGTSGLSVSKIQLDRKTSLIQSRVLAKILKTILPNEKLTIFFIEAKNESSNKFTSARSAAVKGFSTFAKEKKFLLDSDNNVDINSLIGFVKQNPEKPFILFGFTSIIWKNLVTFMKMNDIKIKKNRGILIHGGGWKKMIDIAVDKTIFNSEIESILGIKKIYNYYGMVEQTGSIFLECEHGFFHPSIFSDVIIRDENLNIANLGEEGLIQVFSLLPQSYPGHSILTEDIGTLEGFDNCQCNRRGKYFSINGRVQGSELRGCSDVY